MAHTLNLKVIAEGVETTEQVKFLESLRCDFIQGHLKCRPKPTDQVLEELLRSFKPPRRASPVSSYGNV